MRSVPVSLLTAISVCFGHGAAHALGFGRTATPSFLGAPLEFSATVHVGPDETLGKECISAEVLAGEIRIPPEQVRVFLQDGGGGDRTVRVTTMRAIDEPVATVDIRIGCGATVSRRFVAFLDPPALQLAQAGQGAADGAAADVATADAVADAPSPPLAAAPRAAAAANPDSHTSRPRTSARAARPGVNAARRGTTHVAAVDAAARERRRGPVLRAAAAVPERGGPRLRLEAAESMLARAPHAASAPSGADGALALAVAGSGGANGARGPAGGSADPAAGATARSAVEMERDQLLADLARERNRIKELESGLASLRAEAQATRQSIAALQARMRESEGARDPSPLVVLLGGLCVLLVGATAVAWRRAALAWRRPARGGRRWFELTQLPADSVADAPAAVVPPAAAAPLPESSADASWTYRRPKLEPVAAVPAPTSIGGLEVTTVIDHAWLARMAAGEEEETAPDALRPEVLSTEALLDLEQQVEFLVVLGQEASAVRLLSAHLDGSAGSSPLPFYLLLEIHRRRNDEAAYARVAQAFHDRFGAIAPGWEEDVGDARSLEDHPAIVAQLEALWARPEDAKRALDGWIFRRQPGDRAFDFGTCRELLFLYAVASDLAALAAGVDVPLPLDGAAVPVAKMAPSPYGAIDVPLRPMLDVDITDSDPLDSRPTPLRRAV